MYSTVSIYKTIAHKQSLVLYIASLNVLPILLAHLFYHSKHRSVSYCRDSFGAKAAWHILSLMWWASWVLPTKSCHFWAFPHLGTSTSWCRNCFPQRLLGPSGAALILPTSGFSWAVVAAPAWCSNSSHQARCINDTDKRSVLSTSKPLLFLLISQLPPWDLWRNSLLLASICMFSILILFGILKYLSAHISVCLLLYSSCLEDATGSSAN